MWVKLWYVVCGHTDAEISLHTLLMMYLYYNDLLGRLSSERGRSEFTNIYVGELFFVHLGTKYINFQEKISTKIFGKNDLTFH